MTYAKLAPLVEYAPVFFHDRLLVETQDGDESRSPWPPLRHAVDDLFLMIPNCPMVKLLRKRNLGQFAWLLQLTILCLRRCGLAYLRNN